MPPRIRHMTCCTASASKKGSQGVLSTRASSSCSSQRGGGGGGGGSVSTNGNDAAGVNTPSDNVNFKWNECLKEGIMTGKPLFENLSTAHRAWEGMSSQKRALFDPIGCLLCVALSVFEDEENPYFYDQYFSGMDGAKFFLQKLFLRLEGKGQQRSGR